MQPYADGGAVFRTAFRPPFWRIELSPRRWEWSISKRTFHGGCPDAQFLSGIRTRLKLPERRGAEVILVALQGDLLTHRRFQSMSPLGMIKETVKFTGDDPVVAAFHPTGRYSYAERAVLEREASRTPRLSLCTGAMDLLPMAKLLVTQNSTVAVAAMALGVPVVLFAKADFHHGCANVLELGVKTAIETALEDDGDRAAYLTWFFQTDVIRAGQPDVLDQIRARLTSLGWGAPSA